MYLSKTSSHPKSTRISIPFGLGLRARRIFSTEESYKIQRNKTNYNLMKRGYSDTDTEWELRKVDKLDRSNLLNYRKIQAKITCVPFVINYSK
jgi:hypothetical protein